MSDGSTKTLSIDNVGSSVSNLLQNNLAKTNVFSKDKESPYNNFETQLSAKIVFDSLGHVASSFDANLDGRSHLSFVGENTFLIELDDVLALKNYVIEHGH